MSTATVNTSSIDSLLDGTLDDLADVPEFKPFPMGAHKVTIKWDIKEINSQPAIELSLTAVETIELTNPETDKPVAAGDTTNVMFMLKKKDGTNNDLAQGQWKELMKPLAAHFGTTSNKATMEASNGAEVLVITDVRKSVSKTDANDIKFYSSIKSLSVI